MLILTETRLGFTLLKAGRANVFEDTDGGQMEDGMMLSPLSLLPVQKKSQSYVLK